MGPMQSVRMARPVRSEIASALYQVTARGDRREAIYEDNVDRDRFLQVLGDVVERFHWRCLTSASTRRANYQERSMFATGFAAKLPTQQLPTVPRSRVQRYASHSRWITRTAAVAAGSSWSDPTCSLAPNCPASGYRSLTVWAPKQPSTRSLPWSIK